MRSWMIWIPVLSVLVVLLTASCKEAHGTCSYEGDTKTVVIAQEHKTVHYTCIKRGTGLVWIEEGK